MATALQSDSILRGKRHSYCINKVLGQGSFGISYQATVAWTDGTCGLTPGTMVAIKELFLRGDYERNQVGDTLSASVQSSRDDFLREAHHLAQLKHPNIVRWLETFETNQTLYYAMEYLDGGSLSEEVRSKGCFSEIEALDCVTQVADALMCMHGKNLLHLDVKPSNIMRRAGGEWVLIDFGNARLCPLETEHCKDDTSSEPRWGYSVGYAPLEQMGRTTHHLIGPATDVYALGGVLYFLLMGATPPDAYSMVEDGFPEAQMMKRGVSKDVVAFVARAMSPSVRKRPQSAQAFYREAQRLRKGASTHRRGSATNDTPCFEGPTLPGVMLMGKFKMYCNGQMPKSMKSVVREMLSQMREVGIGTWRHTGDATDLESTHFPIFSLADDSLKYLIQVLEESPEILNSANREGLTVVEAITAIQRLARWTSLPFRLATRDELCFERTLHPAIPYLKTLCYNVDCGFTCQVQGTGGWTIPDEVTIQQQFMTEQYDVQLVCDGLSPQFLFHTQKELPAVVALFDVPWTQFGYLEIVPIGFGLYAVRDKDNGQWNICSPAYPTHFLLMECYDSISSIGIYHLPGGGPCSGYDFFGITARSGCLTSYYEYQDGQFRLIECLTPEEINERATWT